MRTPVLESPLPAADLSLLSGHTGLPAVSQTHQGNSYPRTFAPDTLSAGDPPRRKHLRNLLPHSFGVFLVTHLCI